jgi:CHAT domain-containing protein/tetratricopeptide (TPR) repeat protein
MRAQQQQQSLSPEVTRDLAGIGNPEGLREFLVGRPDLLTREVVQQLAEAVRQSVRVDVTQALHLADASMAIAAELGDAESLGLSIRAKGNALWYTNDYRRAVALFDEAAGCFERAGNQEEIGRTLSTSIQPLVLLGEYDRALEAADRARTIFVRLNEPRRLARLELNIANVHHRQDRFAEALACYERAYDQLLPYKDAEALGVALHNISVCLIMLNDFERALRTYSRAREICDQNGMPLLARQADYNIAYLYFLRGDYFVALERLRATRELCLAGGDAYHAALCDLDRSEIYLELNLAREAARIAEDARHQFRHLTMPFEEARCTVNLAIAMHREGRPEQSYELFDCAREAMQREGNTSWQALIDYYQSVVRFETGDYSTAKRICQQALDFFASSGLERREILSQLLLVRIALSEGEVQSAQQLCGNVLQKVEKTECPLLEFQSNLLMGHVYSESGAAESAYSCYQQARMKLENLRSAVQGDELKIAFLRDKVDVYEQLVRLSMESNQAGQAFIHMEQAKSRALGDLLFGRAAPTPLRLASGNAERLQALRRELNWYYHRLEIEQTAKETISAERITTLRRELGHKEDEFLRLLRELPLGDVSQNPLAAADVTALDAIQAGLGPETTLIEYFQVNLRFLAAIVTENCVRIASLGSVSEITASIQMLEFQMARLSSGFRSDSIPGYLFQAVSSRLRQLYKDVIEPLASYIQGSHLVIVPHGTLHYLPFQALMDGDEHIIDRFTITYAPSASIHAARHAKAVDRTGPSLLLGLPDEMAPWIAREIESVASVVPEPRVFVGPEATETVLRKEGPRARLIHIATHGCFRSDNPMFSSVKLADGYLSLHELYRLDLPAELVTLSGCGTGLSEVAAGDELLGLIRGLLCAGAQGILATLWDVRDHTTADFMAIFYRDFSRTGNKYEALRNAMLELRKDYPHPYYWAPFILIQKNMKCIE